MNFFSGTRYAGPFAASPGSSLPQRQAGRIILLLFTWLLFVQAASAQFEPSPTILTMPLDVGNGFVPPRGPSRVSVALGDTVHIHLPETVQLPVQWTKDGQPIENATARTLVLPAVASENAGVYRFGGLPWPLVACGIDLDVGPAGRTSNLSARFELTPDGPPAIIGFVVGGSTPKLLLYRAVGPSLKAFGITNPASDPVIRIFDAKGQEVFPGPRLAVVLDYPGWFASLGAFPLTGGEAPGRAFDFGVFPPGAYTAHVQDAGGKSGTVLVELYEAGVGPKPL